MKISLFTLGCKVNQYESQAISELFKKNGYVVTDIDDNPDIIIVNSCTVTAESDRKTRQTVRKFKRKYKDCIVVLTGCMAQASPEKAKEIFDADIVVGNRNYNEIINTVNEYLKSNDRIVDVLPHENGEKFTTPAITEFNERTRAYMKIEDGCNRFCSYCIIPFARGRVRSRSIESIKKEAEDLSRNGFSEIVLVGINLSAYGNGTDLELCDAVKAVAEVDGIRRIRLGSLEPDQISDRTFTYLKNCDKFCPNFHLSLQSGCDKTLKAMNRHYDTELYRSLVNKIRQTFDNPSVTTDIMVGFAGETEEDFNESLQFAKEMQFAKAHIFAYSRRKGTKADLFPNQVKNSEKQSRSRRMIECCESGELGFHKNQIGKTAEVLFETYSDGYSEGYSKNYTKVKVKTESGLHGRILPVKITEAETDFCVGELL